MNSANYPVLTIQQICSAAGKEWKKQASKKAPPPTIAEACDRLTLDILRVVCERPGATGAQISGMILAQSPFHCSAEAIYQAACALASPLMCRHPLLLSGDVFLPERPPPMWDSSFYITEVGQDVLDGVLPNCLINGYQSTESKMPPIRVRSVGEAVAGILSLHDSSPETLDIKLGDVDFACPCVIEGHGYGAWTGSGKGALTCVPNCEVIGNEVHLNMIPYGLEQSKSLETLTELLEDVPGVDECEARSEKLPVSWYRLVVKCKNEQAARSCLEAVLAGSSLKSKVKISYVVSGPDGQRVHSNPQEILRGFVSALVERGVDVGAVAKKLAQMDTPARCVSRTTKTQTSLGPQVLWAFDSSGRNKVIALPFIKKQARGGKGSRISPSDLRTIFLCRVRQRAALLGANGNVSILDVRAADNGETWGHPAETLPEGCQGVCFGLGDSERKFVVIGSCQGYVKKMDRGDFSGGRRGTKLSMKVSGGDSVAGACWADEDDDLVIVTAKGQGLRFKLKQVRSMGGAAKGVSGMSLREGDRVVAVVALRQDEALAIFSSDGCVKVLDKEEIPLQNRGGVGVKLIEMTEGVVVAGACAGGAEGDFFVAARGGKLIRFPIQDIPSSRRGGAGTSAMEIDGGDSVIFSAANTGGGVKTDGEPETTLEEGEPLAPELEGGGGGTPETSPSGEESSDDSGDSGSSPDAEEASEGGEDS